MPGRAGPSPAGLARPAGRRVTGRGRGSAACSPPAARRAEVPQDRRRSSSRHGTGGLSQPMTCYSRPTGRRRQSYLASISQLPSCTATSQAAPSSVTSWNLARLRAARGCHHRSATGHGPAQAVTASHGAPSADIRAGGAETSAAPADGHRGTGAVGDPGGQRGRVDRGRRRRGDPPRPGLRPPGPPRPSARPVRPARLPGPARPAAASGRRRRRTAPASPARPGCGRPPAPDASPRRARAWPARGRRRGPPGR